MSTNQKEWMVKQYQEYQLYCNWNNSNKEKSYIQARKIHDFKAKQISIQNNLQNILVCFPQWTKVPHIMKVCQKNAISDKDTPTHTHTPTHTLMATRNIHAVTVMYTLLKLSHTYSRKNQTNTDTKTIYHMSVVQALHTTTR